MWYTGDLGNYSWEAKVYDEPSRYGIYGGRVSKLRIRDCFRNWVVNYDRGWDVVPEGETIGIFEELLVYLENLPLRKEVALACVTKH